MNHPLFQKQMCYEICMHIAHIFLLVIDNVTVHSTAASWFNFNLSLLGANVDNNCSVVENNYSDKISNCARMHALFHVSLFFFKTHAHNHVNNATSNLFSAINNLQYHQRIIVLCI